MSQELIRLIQEPIIEEKLRALKVEVEQLTVAAMSLVCTEETVQTVKATRSDLNKRFAELEDQRKAVKSAVLGPYNQFEVIYKECVSDAFKRADAALKQKVNDVEGEMKRRCEDGLRDYFAELCTVHNIDFVPYERAGVVISLADAKAKTQPPKKLREQLSEFVARIAADVDVISTMDGAEEILVEFKQSLDASRSVALVQARHRAIEEAKAARAAREESKAREEEAVKRVEAFAPPVAKEPDPEPVSERTYRCTFTVRATKSQLKRLKEFMTMEGIKYE